MRYEEALRLVYRRRNCVAYSREADAQWPPCCSECGCVAEANLMVLPITEENTLSPKCGDF